MNRYIIKNCPCYCEKLLSHDFSTNTSEVADKGVCMGSISNSDYHCQDCTDCVLKQIIELAKGHTELCKNCEQQIKECDCNNICNAYRLNKILQLLDIQEVK